MKSLIHKETRIVDGGECRDIHATGTWVKTERKVYVFGFCVKTDIHITFTETIFPVVQ